MRVWRILCNEGLYPYHIQWIQCLQPGDLTQQFKFCLWFSGHLQWHHYILFIDEAQSIHDAVNNTHNSHLWSDVNPHGTVESNFHHHFLLICSMMSLAISLLDHLFLRVVLQVTFMKNSLSCLLDVSLIRWSYMYLQHDRASPGQLTSYTYLKCQHPDQATGCKGLQSWPLMSPHLNPLHFHLCATWKPENCEQQLNSFVKLQMLQDT